MPSSFPVARPVIPNAFGIEGPVISASNTAVWYPFLWNWTASIEDTIDFPTPPFPLTIPITLRIVLFACGFSKKLFGSRLEQSAEQLEQSWLQFSISLIIFLPSLKQKCLHFHLRRKHKGCMICVCNFSFLLFFFHPFHHAGTVGTNIVMTKTPGYRCYAALPSSLRFGPCLTDIHRMSSTLPHSELSHCLQHCFVPHDGRSHNYR